MPESNQTGTGRITVFPYIDLYKSWRWSSGAMVLVNFQCRGVLLIWIRVGQGPTALAVGAGGDCLDIFFSRLSFLFSLSLSLGDGPI